MAGTEGRILHLVQSGIHWQDPRLGGEGGLSQQAAETENLQDGGVAQISSL